MSLASSFAPVLDPVQPVQSLRQEGGAGAMPPSVPAHVHAAVQQVVAGGRTAGAPWATGVPALDRALGGGIPRGRITELTGPVAVGKTALLRQVVAQVLGTGAWVAWIDAGRTLAPAPWAELGERFVVIRLPEPKRAAWTADLLLRSGVFGLVVLDGAPPLGRVHGVRLAQLARERDAACVVLEHVIPGEPRGHRLAGTVRVRVALSTPPSMRGPSSRPSPASSSSSSPSPTRHAHHPPPASAPPSLRTHITVEKGGASTNSQPIEVPRVVVLARRVCTHSEIPDRRGVARSARRPWTARGNSTDAAPDGRRDQQRHDQPRSEHPVTWGGLGVGSHDLYGTDLPGHPARLAAGLDAPGDRLSGDRFGGDRFGGDRFGGDRGRSEHEFDRRTRDWATYRGRRRAAESGFGRRGRRDLAREHTGALLAGGGGQSAPRSTSRSAPRDDHRPESRHEPRDPPRPAPESGHRPVAPALG